MHFKGSPVFSVLKIFCMLWFLPLRTPLNLLFSFKSVSLIFSAIKSFFKLSCCLGLWKSFLFAFKAFCTLSSDQGQVFFSVWEGIKQKIGGVGRVFNTSEADQLSKSWVPLQQPVTEVSPGVLLVISDDYRDGTFKLGLHRLATHIFCPT